MPTYDYRCLNCGHTFEQSQKITETPLTTCSECHQSSLQRGPGGGIGLIFKGSGFHCTDYGPARQTEEKSNSNKGCCPCGKPSSCTH